MLRSLNMHLFNKYLLALGFLRVGEWHDGGRVECNSNKRKHTTFFKILKKASPLDIQSLVFLKTFYLFFVSLF